MTSISDGCDFLGQPLRKHARRHGTPATLQRTPSTGSCQGSTAQVKALCQQAVGAPRPGAASVSTPCCGGGPITIDTCCGPTPAPHETVLSGGGCLDGPSSGTRRKPAVGAPPVLSPIKRANPGGSPIQRAGSRSSECKRRLPLSATARSRGTPTRSIRHGRRTANTMIDSEP
jgi:hypothetical protein